MNFEETNIKSDTKEAIWVPPELKYEIKLQATKEQLPIWKYIARLHKKYVEKRMEKE